MAFKTAAGYGNLPNGNFSPVIYSKKVQSAFRKTSVIEDITNSDYFGEIANFGDTVRIIKNQKSQSASILVEPKLLHKISMMKISPLSLIRQTTLLLKLMTLKKPILM